MTNDNLNITIIGASKGLGKWIACKLIEDNYNVKITSRNKEYGERIAEEIGASYENDNIKAVSDADIIIFSVPIENMIDTIKIVAPHAPAGCLLVDVSSVKIDVTNALLKYTPSDCEILPCHPMFGPRVPHIDGQVVILTPLENRCDTWYDKVIEYLKQKRTNIVISTPEEHDKTMSVVQGLTHFSYISIASTIKKLDISVKKSREFASPIYALMLDMISRIVSQNPYLYYSIQKSNSLTSMARNALIEESIKLAGYVDEDDVDSFVNNMTESAKHLNEFEEALGRSDKAISVLTWEVNYLTESIGKEVGLEHQYSHNIHVGIVEDVDAKTVILNENNKSVKLRLSNVRILSDKELYQWKKDNLKLYSFDVSVVLDDDCDKDIILDLLDRLDEVVSVELIDEYHGQQIRDNQVSLTFHYTTFNKEDRDIVEKYLKGIGGKIR
ncbi:MAG: prephenate dehydrogenase [Methanosphaera sp. rholeuAM130]|nr:MAG: prephenate dehydrogenase [Methanosphaera sp. rholeuAM130]